jgi:hypothetical protein
VVPVRFVAHPHGQMHRMHPDDSRAGFSPYQGNGYQVGGEDSRQEEDYYYEEEPVQYNPPVQYSQQVRPPQPIRYNPPVMQVINGNSKGDVNA